MTTTTTVKDERVWKGDQSLYGTRIVQVKVQHGTAVLFRARIRRDSYDSQCEATVETWCAGRGWREVQTVPCRDLPIFSCSYVSQPEKWHAPMRASLEQLCTLAWTILQHAA